MSAPDAWQELSETLLGPSSLTSTEVARIADVDMDFARRLWRALGFPPVPDDARVFTRSDADVLRAAREVADRLPMSPGVLLQIARVTGQAAGRLAEAQITATDAREPAAGAASASERWPWSLAALVPDLERMLGHVWRRHLLVSLFRLAAAPSAADTAGTVGFADLVGFTSMSRTLDARRLAAVVDRFEAVAYEHVVHHGGRVVKMIGDEVMFVADDRVAAAEIALALVDAYAADPLLADVRVGLAEGPLLAWQGDLLGPTVNLAHRLVTLARPRTVLVADELGTQLAADPRFVLRHLRRARLEGLGRLRSWLLRRAVPPKGG